MIRSICFNPVIDRVYFIDDFSIGDKFKEVPPQICIGGKGVNIARVASQLDECCTLYSFIGGYGGKLIREEMKQLNVQFKYCETDGETRTTINVIDNKNHKETEITEASVPVTHEQEKHLLDILENDIQPGDIVICSGIPMAGMHSGVYKAISNRCREQGAKCVLDTNSRYLPESLPSHYTFLKPNLAELMELHKVDAITDQDQMVSLARRTLQLGVENLMVSTGRSGGLFFNKDLFLNISVPDEPVKSTIGSGDSTVAGFCIALQRGYSLQDCLKFAMACGVCNAMFSQVGHVERDIVEKLMEKIIIETL